MSRQLPPSLAQTASMLQSNAPSPHQQQAAIYQQPMPHHQQQQQSLQQLPPPPRGQSPPPYATNVYQNHRTIQPTSTAFGIKKKD
uniref:Uncharacterized protein n=1 Tax=Globodera rostochiensis TaxID=31243 RepID=A0A914HZU8_GLORO